MTTTPQPDPTPIPQPRPGTPWNDPAPILPTGPRTWPTTTTAELAPVPAPYLDLDRDRWYDAHPDATAPGAARVIARDPHRPGVYTVALTRCACGAVTGECGCPRFAAGLAVIR